MLMLPCHFKAQGPRIYKFKFTRCLGWNVKNRFNISLINLAIESPEFLPQRKTSWSPDIMGPLIGGHDVACQL